jgi:WD40 repeat protein
MGLLVISLISASASSEITVFGLPAANSADWIDQQIAIGTYEGVYMYDLSLDLIAHAPISNVHTIALRPDGHQIAIAHDETLTLWPLDTGEVRVTIPNLSGPLLWVDLATLWAVQDTTLQRIDAETGQITASLTGHNAPIRWLGLWGEQALISIDYSGVMLVWDRFSGDPIALTVPLPRFNPLFAADLSPDQTELAWIGESGTRLARFNLITGERFSSSLPVPYGSALRWNPDGRSITTFSQTEQLIVWDGLTLTPQATRTPFEPLPENPYPLANTALLFGQGDPWLTVTDGSIRLWQDNAPTHTLWTHTSGVRTFNWSPEGSLIASADEDHRLRLWDATNATLQCVFEGIGGILHSLDWDAKGERLLIGYGSARSTGVGILIMDRACQVLDQAALPALGVDQAHWSPDDAVIAVALTGAGWVLFDANEDLQAFYQVSALTWLEGRFIAWGSSIHQEAIVTDDHQIRLSDGTSFEVGDRPIDQLLWSSDNAYLVASTDENVRIWRVSDSTLIGDFTADQAITSIAWQPDAFALLVGDRQGQVWHYDLTTGIRDLIGQRDTPITELAWSPDGQRWLSATQAERLQLHLYP